MWPFGKRKFGAFVLRWLAGGIVFAMWPFGKRSKDEETGLGPMAVAVQDIIRNAFDSPGPLYTPERRQILSAWLGNFARNLGAAVSAVETGQDVRGQPISRNQILQGLRRMCDEYGRTDTLKRLEDVCGTSIRCRFEKVLRDVRSFAS